MIIYCYEMNSLSCLSSFSCDPPNVDSILIQKMILFLFYKHNFFLRVLRAGSESLHLFVCRLWKMPQVQRHHYCIFFFELPKVDWDSTSQRNGNNPLNIRMTLQMSLVPLSQVDRGRSWSTATCQVDQYSNSSSSCQLGLSDGTGPISKALLYNNHPLMAGSLSLTLEPTSR